MEKKITIIPASIPFPTKQRVAIYCRVSSATGAQLHSLAAQASYLTKYVMCRFGMLLEDIYLDVESGSSTIGREEFKRMMEDAKNGAFDLIITKSISRFGRDTEDILTATRELSAHGVYVLFEEQSLNSRSPESELYISLYGSQAQAENLNLSENIKWGIRRKIENGSSPIYDRPCYGYQADENELVVEPEEANVVRRIFAMYLCGMSILKIKATLEAERITSPTGKNIWSKRTIDMILSNKKYCGFSIARSGKDPYLIENHHEPIISSQVFDQVKAAKVERTNTEIGDDGRKIRKNIKFTSQKLSESFPQISD